MRARTDHPRKGPHAAGHGLTPRPGIVHISFTLFLMCYNARFIILQGEVKRVGKMLLVVLCFIVCDFLSGIAAAIYRKEFKSSCMREGLVHKSIEIAIVLLSIAVQWALPIVGIEIHTPVYPVASVYIVIMELSSICENIGKINPAMAGLVSKLFGGYTNSEHNTKGD